jgi:hypothetical protein
MPTPLQTAVRMRRARAGALGLVLGACLVLAGQDAEAASQAATDEPHLLDVNGGPGSGDDNGATDSLASVPRLLGIVYGNSEARSGAIAPRPIVDYSGQIPLPYLHSGPVITSAKVVFIFWGKSFSDPSSDQLYAQTLQNFRNQFGTTPEFNVITQYYQNLGSGNQFIQLANLGSGTDDYFDSSNPVPKNVTDGEVQAEVISYLTRTGINFDSSTIYEVFIPASSYSSNSIGNSCGGPDPNHGYCAYHSYFVNGSNVVKYSIQPYPSCPGCQVPSSGWSFVQNQEMFVGHETREGITDPLGNAWVDILNGRPIEADDMCAWSPTPFLGTGGYAYQYEWSNAAAACVKATAYTTTHGATLVANPLGGVAPFATELTAETTGVGFGNVNYTFWWDCPFLVSTVQQGIAQCGDPTNPAIGNKTDNLPDLSWSASHIYDNAGTYAPLVVVERNTSAATATTNVVVNGPAACTSFTIAPGSASPGPRSGAQEVAVVGSPAGCQGGSWTANGNGSWLTVSPAAGAGSGTVTVAWAANTVALARSANATVAGGTFFVTQAGTAVSPPAAPYLLSPGASVFPGTTTSLLSPGFYWQPVAGADSYQLELSDSSTIYPVTLISAPQTSVILQNPLADNHAYKWRMQSHNAAGWGAFGGYYYFSTYTGLATGDFTISVVPTTAAVSPGASAAFVIATSSLTVESGAQTLTLNAGNLPAGISEAFSPSSIQSGEQTVLTFTVGIGTAPGAYAIAVSATSTLNVTHEVTIGLTVNAAPGTGEPAICLSPSSLGFADQQLGTSSPVQTIAINSCGNGPLHVASLGASPDFFIGPGSIVPPFDLVAGGSTTFQVGFSPLGTGLRTGSVKIFSNAPGSPTSTALMGNGLAAPATTGTVNVQATLNGQPFTGVMYFNVTGPGGTIDFGNAPLSWTNQGAGSYTVGFAGSPPGGGTLNSIVPASTQTLNAGGAVSFTFNFTAQNEFAFSGPTATVTGTTGIMVTPVGGNASVPVTAWYVRGGTQTITLAASGLPAGATASFSPQPIQLTGVNASSNMIVTTSAATPPGLYQLLLTATNADGTVHSLTGTLVVTTGTYPALVSTGPGATQSDGFSDLPSVSADGRYLAFFSLGTTLVAGDTNGAADVLVRDLQAGTTSRASVASDGTQANDFSGEPAISADGRFVAFRSVAGNLVPGGRHGFGDIYRRDQQLGQTVQVNLSSGGVPSDGGCFYPSVSGDGRFVAFNSNSTNLVTGGGGGVPQIYVRDMQTGQTSVTSVGTDGSLGNADSTNPIISGDGRYVAFFSDATNFAPGATASGRQVFLHDRQTGTTQLVSGRPDGTPPNAAAYLDSEERLAMSLDGRYVAFTSLASNLTAGNTNAAPDVFVWDKITNTTTVVSVANDGTLFYGGGGAPAISADGRFVAFRVYPADAPAPQIAVRDMTTLGTVLFSVGPGDVLGSQFSAATAISANGRVLAFSSNAPNLVAGDTNGQQDIFSLHLPASTSAYVMTIAVNPSSVPGGSTATGTLTLSAPAPAGGASVAFSSSALEAAVPAIVTVPAGSTTATFAVPTLYVAAELPVSITASYGGGSAWALLRLEPVALSRIDIVQGDGQVVANAATLTLPFSVRVLDAANNPASNVAVLFSAPTSGPSGTFGGGATSFLVLTDASGIATAPAFTANSVQGQYAVVASAPGVSLPAVFTEKIAGMGFYTLTPCRLLDTRSAPGSLGGPALVPGGTRQFAVAGSCGVPVSAVALSVNVTIVQPTNAGDLRVFPAGTVAPYTSTINFAPGQVVANNAIVLLGAGGFAVLLDSAGTTHLICDVNGYFQ